MATLRRFGFGTTVLAAMLVGGCYEGLEDSQGVPWDGGSTGAQSQASDPGSPGDPGDPDDSEAGSTGSEPGADTAAEATDSGSDPTGDGSGDDPTGDPTAGDDTTGDPTEDPTGEPMPPSDEVPDNGYCADVADWNPGWTQLEVEILAIVNQRRSEGADCGTAGSFGPAGPLTMNPALRCAARVHSQDMVDRSFFAHDNPSGESPFDRMGLAGYDYSSAGENIAAGNSTAADTMQQWMDSDGHCGNIMNDGFTELGVGYYPGGQYGHVWTQAFGRP